MHIRLRTLDVIMQIVTEQLNMRDRRRRHVRFSEMAREQHKSDIAGIFGISQTRDMADLEGRVTIRVEHLRGILN